MKWSKDAGTTLQAFTDYVESKTGTSQAVLPIISGFVDVGMKVWNGLKDREAKDRAERANTFEKDAQWEDWDKIK